MRRVYIQPTQKTATQSGSVKTGKWQMIFDQPDQSMKDPLMGWDGCCGPDLLPLSFETKEAAVSYAQQKGYVFYLPQ